MRLKISSLLLALTFALPCAAQGNKAKPNTLTPKEIADGWILLFDGATTFGWKATGEDWLGKDGTLSSPSLKDYVCLATPFSEFVLRFDYHNGMRWLGTVHLCDSIPGEKIKGDKILLPEGNGWHHAEIRVTPTHYSGSVVDRDETTAPIPYTKRQNQNSFTFIAMHGAERLEQPGLKLKNIKLRPLNTTSLFNGKDLTGWKTFPGDKYKSKFSVNDKGELNVKDGPGDLQTLGKYKDFVLQLECISNGKHLNSGIFFRCRDNEYQNGYEAQIRNQFTKEPTQKYTIDEYDPKTNKLVGKKEIKSTAFDFGTGAIYRRVPARKEMSKDGEWFSMTIAAQGNHFATWVNGVQVTDWTDNRPKSDNARTGCRLDAGHLSIQGHDPTTDLSFRNIRIAEMK